MTSDPCAHSHGTIHNCCGVSHSRPANPHSKNLPERRIALAGGGPTSPPAVRQPEQPAQAHHRVAPQGSGSARSDKYRAAHRCTQANSNSADRSWWWTRMKSNKHKLKSRECRAQLEARQPPSLACCPNPMQLHTKPKAHTLTYHRRRRHRHLAILIQSSSKTRTRSRGHGHSAGLRMRSFEAVTRAKSKVSAATCARRESQKIHDRTAHRNHS